MENLADRIFEEIKGHMLVCVFLVLAVVYALLFGQMVVGLVLFSLAIGILIGQETPK